MAKIVTLKNRILDLETLWSTKFYNQKCTLVLKYKTGERCFLHWDSDNGFRLIFEHRECPSRETILIKDGIVDSTYFDEELMQEFAKGLIKMEKILSTDVPDSVVEVFDKLMKK